MNVDNPYRESGPTEITIDGESKPVPEVFAQQMVIPAGGYAVVIQTGYAGTGADHDGRGFMNYNVIYAYGNVVRLVWADSGEALTPYVDQGPVISGHTTVVLATAGDADFLLDEAVLAGAEAARAALAGENGVMVGLRRVPGPVYQVETFLIPVEQVMLYERKMPDEYISADGCDVTDAFVEWCRPLIGSPLRQFVTFKPTL